MGYGDKNEILIVAKCRIDAKDASGSEVRGFYMCVANAREVEYDGALFSRDAIDSEAPLSELLSALEAPRSPERPKELERYENALKDYINTSRLFQNEKNLNDPKTLERKITYFCTSALSLSAISFLEITSMSRNELYLSMPSLKREDEPEKNEERNETEGQADKDASDDSAPRDVAVACDPVLDPVAGVAAGDLSVGDAICCKLREESVFYSLMARASPGFKGVVSGDITAIRVNETGSATLALKLSDGVIGALKLNGSVRIKVLSRKEQDGTSPGKSPFRLDVLLAVSGIALFLLVMLLLSRILG
jgi:hypothetical protein